MLDQAGRAARWLAAYGLAGPEQLAGLLAMIDGNVPAHAPVVDDTPWTALAGDLCPVQVGAALSDRADELVAGVTYRIGPTTHSLIVLPFLCRVARDLKLSIAVTIGDAAVVATLDGPAWKKLPGPEPASITVSRREQCDMTPVPPRPEARAVPAECWRALDELAARTYVLATAASRESGAGAGISDHDRGRRAPQSP